MYTGLENSVSFVHVSLYLSIPSDRKATAIEKTLGKQT